MKKITYGCPLVCILAACLCIHGCGGTRPIQEDAGKKGPQMSLEKIHFYEVEKGEIRWEGWAQRAEAQEFRGRIILSGVRFSLTGEGHQIWFVEGETGFWDPEVKKIMSEGIVRIHGLGIDVEGKGFDMDMTLQTAVLGENVSASIEGFWLEQK